MEKTFIFSIEIYLKPTPIRTLSRGPPYIAPKAVCAFPAFAREKSATKSPIELAGASTSNPMIVFETFQKTPKDVKILTT